MKRIGLLSDTHGYWNERFYKYFEECDEIWHAGDIGSIDIIKKFESFKPFRGVYGNIDGQDIRKILPEINKFNIEDTEVVIKHIGGYPGKYDISIRNILDKATPKLLVCGHSHILKVKYDKEHEMLYINPGAAGKYGFHTVRTLVRFNIDRCNFSELEVIELKD